MKVCAAQGCAQPRVYKSLCKKHYDQARKSTEAGLAKHRSSMRMHRETVKSRFYYGRRQAEEKGRCWEITEQDYKVLVSLPCFYCGGSLPKRGCGLDRVDNAEGYKLGNVVPCCTNCNMTRANRFTAEEMRIVAATLLVARRADAAR